MPLKRLTVILAALAALPSSAQTPETPGPEGARAAVVALVAAQRAQDWPTVVRLVDPAILAEAAGDMRAFAFYIDAMKSDVESGRIDSLVYPGDTPEWAAIQRADSERAIVRYAAFLPEGNALSDAEVLTRALAATGDAVDRTRATMAGNRYRSLGAVPGDGVTYVVGTFGWVPMDQDPSVAAPGAGYDPVPDLTTAVWSGDRWTVRFDAPTRSFVTDYLVAALLLGDARDAVLEQGRFAPDGDRTVGEDG